MTRGHRPGHSRNTNNVEAGPRHQDDDIGLPRIVARIWGLVAGISYVSNGGYLLVQTNAGNEKCQGAGGYMIFIGLMIIIMECACCICPIGGNNCCDKFEAKFPFWARGLLYFLSVIPPLAICFGVKTLISSIIVIMLALLYVFLTCLVRSKKYERLQGEARARYQTSKKNAQVTYSAINSTTNTVSYLKANAAAQKNKGRQARSKKPKPRHNTAPT